MTSISSTPSMTFANGSAASQALFNAVPIINPTTGWQMPYNPQPIYLLPDFTENYINSMAVFYQLIYREKDTNWTSNARIYDISDGTISSPLSQIEILLSLAAYYAAGEDVNIYGGSRSPYLYPTFMTRVLEFYNNPNSPDYYNWLFVFRAINSAINTILNNPSKFVNFSTYFDQTNNIYNLPNNSFIAILEIGMLISSSNFLSSSVEADIATFNNMTPSDIGTLIDSVFNYDSNSLASLQQLSSLWLAYKAKPNNSLTTGYQNSLSNIYAMMDVSNSANAPIPANVALSSAEMECLVEISYLYATTGSNILLSPLSSYLKSGSIVAVNPSDAPFVAAWNAYDSQATMQGTFNNQLTVASTVNGIFSSVTLDISNLSNWDVQSLTQSGYITEFDALVISFAINNNIGFVDAIQIFANALVGDNPAALDVISGTSSVTSLQGLGDFWSHLVSQAGNVVNSIAGVADKIAAQIGGPFGRAVGNIIGAVRFITPFYVVYKSATMASAVRSALETFYHAHEQAVLIGLAVVALTVGGYELYAAYAASVPAIASSAGATIASGAGAVGSSVAAGGILAASGIGSGGSSSTLPTDASGVPIVPPLSSGTTPSLPDMTITIDPNGNPLIPAVSAGGVTLPANLTVPIDANGNPIVPAITSSSSMSQLEIDALAAGKQIAAGVINGTTQGLLNNALAGINSKLNSRGLNAGNGALLNNAGSPVSGTGNALLSNGVFGSSLSNYLPLLMAGIAIYTATK